MNNENKKTLLGNKGITLIELVIVIPLIVVVIALSYNMIFLIQRSFREVNKTFNVSEETRIFRINITKEANSAKKAEESKNAIHRINKSEIYIYSDIDNSDGKNIPELIRYRIADGSLKRSVKTATGEEYPYSYASSFSSEEIILNNILEEQSEFYSDEPIRIVDESSQEAPDYRRKLRMKLIVEAEPNNIELQSYLISKSRTEAE